MKTFVLIVSEHFPATHPRAGEPTYFVDSILYGIKKTTFRENYELWEKRVSEVNQGKAIISVRVWTGKPYNSKQKEVIKLNHVGVIKIDEKIWKMLIRNKHNLELIASHDGLTSEEFLSWFEKPKFPMAQLFFNSKHR